MIRSSGMNWTRVRKHVLGEHVHYPARVLVAQAMAQVPASANLLSLGLEQAPIGLACEP